MSNELQIDSGEPVRLFDPSKADTSNANQNSSPIQEASDLILGQTLSVEQIIAVEPDTFQAIREMYDFSDIHFIPTLASNIGKPEQFLEKVKQIQDSPVFEGLKRPTIKQNAATLNDFIDFRAKIQAVRNQMRAVNSGKIRYPELFLESKKNQIDELENERKNVYKIGFAFDKLIEHGILTEENFEELYNAALINLRELFRNPIIEDTYVLDNRAVERYRREIDQYVRLQEAPRLI